MRRRVASPRAVTGASGAGAECAGVFASPSTSDAPESRPAILSLQSAGGSRRAIAHETRSLVASFLHMMASNSQPAPVSPARSGTLVRRPAAVYGDRAAGDAAGRVGAEERGVR